jgi:hypothetical protein
MLHDHRRRHDDCNDTPFEQRLAAAFRLVDLTPRHVPLSVLDQAQAAADESLGILLDIGQAMATIDPEREWRHTVQDVPSADVRAHLLAGLLGCRPCIHLRREGPQPAMAALALRKVMCMRCLGTSRRPPAGEDDRCDLCGTRGVEVFVPLTVNYGAVLVGGDVCSQCADALGVGTQGGVA